ncbi:GTP binding protein [Wallemia mellicola]|nr:GTP binding protein [Wallemia mellicola]
MRDTLGEKLKEDAEELDRREVQINALTETNDKQTAKVAELESSLQDQEDRNAQLSNDLSTLRARISSSEKASTDESSQMQSRLRDLEKILDKVKMEREEWQSQADEEHLRCESALESNKDLLEELETIKNEYKGVNGSLQESEKALRNVESLLSESQLTNQQEFDELKQHYELQLKELKQKNEEQRKEVADAKANLELFRQDAERMPELEQECKEKTLLIGKVRHEAVILNEHLTEALKRLKEYNTSDSVDRQLMSNILLQFVTTPRSDGKRFEMLNLLASILSWNQYEREQAGIAPKSSRYPIPSSPDSPSSYFRRSTSRTRPAMTNIEDNASFGQLYSLDTPALYIDDQIRDWVLFPITLVMILVGLLRHYVVQLLGGAPKKQDIKSIREQRSLMRSAILRQNGKVLTNTAFVKRKQYLIESFKDGKYLKVAPPKEGDQPQLPPNPLSDPDQMDNMMDGMKKQMVMFIPQTVIMGWINSFFSGFVLIKLPFPLTRGFKAMLQRGIMTPDMPASYLLLGDGNKTDSVRDMQSLAALSEMSSPINIAVEPAQPQAMQAAAAQPKRNLRKSKDQESNGIDNFELPKSTVTKLAKEGVPDGIKFQKDTLLALQKSSSVFINYLAAQEKAHDKSNKTVNAAHILAAVKELDIGTQKGELEEILNEELKAYKTIQETKAANKTQQQIEKEDNAAETNNPDEFDETHTLTVMASARRGRKSVKKGLQFTVMVVGASGTGRTTFVNTLCESEVLQHKANDSPETAHIEEGIKIKPLTVELDEEGFRIALTIVDTPGFGDNINNESNFQEIVGYLERQYDDILAEESRIKRNPRFRDNRVHALLYFIPPTGHSLREMDIELMRRLSPRVNVIPVIGKADSLTPSELKTFKKRVMEDIEHYEIPIYSFPYDVEEDDEETVMDNSELRAMLPFAIVGSEEEMTIDGEVVRARRYPWGVVNVDDPAHSDFSRLRSALLSSHLTDLKEITHDFLYENYRTEKLSRTATGDGSHYPIGNSSSMGSNGEDPEAVRYKEEQLRREEEKFREIELRVQREIAEKRAELAAKEENLRHLGVA